MLKSISILICFITINLGWIVPVQSVCKVTLKNGTEVEGFVSIFDKKGMNYYERGFLTTYTSDERKCLFNLDFEGFEIKKENGREYLYTKGEGGYGYIMSDLFFIEYEIENKNNQRSYESDIDTVHNRLTQRRETISNYIILDSIEIFLELPSHQTLTNLPEDEKPKSRKIATSDIKIFSFEKNPSEYLKEKIKENSGFFGIWWYHRIHKKEKEEQKNIRKTIRQNLRE